MHILQMRKVSIKRAKEIASQVKSFSLACSLSYIDNYGKMQMVINIKRQTTLHVSWEISMQVKK